MPVRVPILMYHSVSDQASPKFRELAIPPQSFHEQMEYLKEHQYSTLTVPEFARMMKRGNLLGERPVLLTFDDGFADFYTNAFPVLHRLNFAATLYVSTAFVGNTSRWLKKEDEAQRAMLNWEQLRKISAGGIECGAHGHTHAALDRLSRTAACDEIVHSKQVLEQELNREVSSFAYPFGYYSASIQNLVRSAGYSSACAVRYRPSSIHDDPFALARLMVTANTALDDFRRLLTGPGVPISTKFKQARACIWKLARPAVYRLSAAFPGNMETG